jgi:hypothetical protein
VRAWVRASEQARGATALALGLLLTGAVASALAPPPSPADPGPLLRLVRAGAPSGAAALPDGARVAQGEPLAFEVGAGTEPPPWLYLLSQSADGALRLLFPTPGGAWPGAPGLHRIVPWPASQSLDAPAPASWTSEAPGRVEYLLIGAPVPRDVSPGHAPANLETFLAPPPYVAGPASAPATVLARRTIEWTAEDSASRALQNPTRSPRGRDLRRRGVETP